MADAGAFVRELNRQLGGADLPRYDVWVQRCQDWKRRYPVVQPEYREQTKGVSTYCLSEAISAELGDDEIVVSGSSGAAIELFLLAFQVKGSQRVLHSRGLGAMGFGLPASIGACLAAGRRRTICVEGDGSFHMNAQELETIRRLRLPIKIFVINNDGYASIRASQENYFHHLVAADSTSGLSLPDVKKLAEAYGLPVGVDHEPDGPAPPDPRGPRHVRCPSCARSSPHPRSSGRLGSQRCSVRMAAWSRSRSRTCGHSLTGEEFLSNMIIAPLDE